MSFILCYNVYLNEIWYPLSLKKLLLAACYFIVLLWHFSSEASAPMLGETKVLRTQLIDTYQLDNKNHLQLRIRFNQSIHRPGETPTSAMLDAISITPDIDCRWFFPNSETLACDAVLPQEAVYRIDIETTFSALGQLLAAPARHEFHAGAWKLELDLPQMLYVAALEHPKLLFADNRWPAEQLARMEWRSPGGISTPVAMEPTAISNNEATAFKLSLTAEESGVYQLVLPAGLTPAQHAERIVWQGHIYQQPKLLGWYCWQLDENDQQKLAYHPIEPTSNNCPPSKLALRFIGDIQFFEQSTGLSQQATLSSQFVSGPEALAAYFPHSDGSWYLHLYLAGHSDYQFHLSRQLPDMNDLRISTNPAEPLWQLATQALDETGPTLIHWPDEAWHKHYKKTNAIEINGVQETLLVEKPLLIPRLHTQRSAQLNLLLQWQHLSKASEFQEWMNAIWQEQPFTSPLFWQNAQQLLPALSSHQTNPTLWHHTQWLNPQDDHKFSQHSAFFQPEHINQSGLYPYRIGDTQRQVQHWLQRPAYNLQLVHVGDLLVRLSDWQDKPKQGASLYRVCPGQNGPLPLGQTDKHGLLLLTAATLQPGPGVSAKAPCWLWAEATEGMATIPLPKPAVVKPLHGWFKTSQPVYQQGDDVELMTILRQRSPQGLIAPTDVSELTVELMTSSGSVLQRWSLQPANDNGWYHKTLPASWFPSAGYYRLHLLQGSRQLESTMIQIARFELPLYRLDSTLTAWAAAGEKSQFELTMQSMTGLGLVSDVRIEGLFRPATLHRQPWLPAGYNFSDHGNYPRPENTNWSLQTDKHGLLRETFGLPDTINISQGAPAYELTLHYETRDMMGEWQRHSKSTLLLNRDHLVGSNVQNQQITFTAFQLQDGKLIATEGVPVSSIQWRAGSATDSPLLAECPLPAVAQLPLTCPLPLSLRTTKRVMAYMHMQSGEPEQLTVRHFTLAEPSPTKKKAPAGATLSAPNQIDNWEPISIELHSPTASNAVLVLYTNQVHQLIPLSLKAGTTLLNLPLTPDMAPELRLALFSTTAEGGWSETYHKIKSSVAAYELSLTLELPVAEPAASLPTASPQTIVLNSAEDADVALFWLDESLLYLFASRHIEHLHPSTLLAHTWNHSSRNYQLAALHKLRRYEMSPWLNPWLAYQNAESVALNMPAMHLADSHTDTRTAEPAVDNLKPVPLWLGMHNVKAGQPRRLTVTTPQWPGQWHLIAIAAGKTKFTRLQHSVKVKDDWQTLLAVPDHNYPTDQAYASVLWFNSNLAPQQGRFKLELNGQELQQFSLNLAAGERLQHAIALPSLPPGQQQLTLWQLDETTSKPPRLLQQQSWQVIPATVQHQSRIQADGSGLLDLPATATEVTASASAVSSLQPDWAALIPVTKQAPASLEALLSEWLLAERLTQGPPRWAHDRSLQSWALPFRKADMYSRYTTTNSNNSVTLFSYWLQSQLADQNALPGTSTDMLKKWRKLLDSHQSSSYEQAMLAWWLSSQNMLNVTELLSLRSQMGQQRSASDSVKTLAILILALQEQQQLAANNNEASQTTILSQQARWLDELLALGYQDASYSALSTESACWLLLAAGADEPRLQGLKQRLTLAQQSVGSFGSAKGNAICTAALFSKSSPLTEPRQLKLTADRQAGIWHYTTKEHDWLSLHYAQPLATHLAQYSGISISKSFRKYQDGEWLPATSIAAGDLLQVVLTLNTPVDREHIRVSDPLLPGMQPLPRRYRQFTGSQQPSDAYFNSAQQQERTMYWHSSYLPAGETILRYVVQVRLPGQYHHGVSRAEAMYDPLVFGSTDGSTEILIQTPVLIKKQGA